MSSRRGGWGAVAAALTAVVAMAGPARADTLAEAFASAYETNPELISGRAALRAADERVNEARAGFRPTLNATIDYGLETTDVSGERAARAGSDQNDPLLASLDARQQLYDGGQTVNDVRGRIADVSAARARLTSLEQQVFLDVVTAYVDVLRDEESVRLAENNVRVIAEQLRASEDRFAVGEVTRTDVSQARARLAESQANLATSVGQLERSRQNYRQVVGAEPQSLRPTPPIPRLPASREEAVDIALERHPNVIAARFDEESRARDVRATIGALLPQVSLLAGLSYQEDGLFGSRDVDQSAATVGVRATIPFYQGGAEYSRIRRAQAVASQARADITLTAREQRRIAEAAWTELEVARANIRSGREQVEAAQLAFEGVREEAIVGSRTTLDVLDAEQELLDARVQLVRSQRDEYVAAYSLLLAIGALTAADLDLTVTPYDPDVNYAANNARLIGYDPSEETQWEEFWRP